MTMLGTKPDPTKAPPQAAPPATGGKPQTSPPAAGGGAPPAPEPPKYPEWRASLPEDLRAEASLDGIADVPTLAKNFVSTKKLVGADKIAVPGKDAKPAEWDQVYAKLGRPESVKGYTVPEGFTDADKPMLDSVLDTAHKAGLSDRQLQPLLQWYALNAQAAQTQQQQERVQQRTEAEAGLRKEWGERYDQNIALALKAVEVFGGKELADHLETNGLGNDPMLVRVFASMGKIVSEHNIGAKGMSGPGSGQMTEEMAKTEIGKKNLDAEFSKALRDTNHPGHAEAKRQWTELHKIAYPGDVVVR